MDWIQSAPFSLIVWMLRTMRARWGGKGIYCGCCIVVVVYGGWWGVWWVYGEGNLLSRCCERRQSSTLREGYRLFNNSYNPSNSIFLFAVLTQISDDCSHSRQNFLQEIFFTLSPEKDSFSAAWVFVWKEMFSANAFCGRIHLSANKNTQWSFAAQCWFSIRPPLSWSCRLWFNLMGQIPVCPWWGFIVPSHSDQHHRHHKL